MKVIENLAYLVKVVGVYEDHSDDQLFEVLIPESDIKGEGLLILSEKVAVRVEIDNRYPTNNNLVRILMDNKRSLEYRAFIPNTLEEEAGMDLLGKTLRLLLYPETALERILKRNPFTVGWYEMVFGNRDLYSEEVYRRLL